MTSHAAITLVPTIVTRKWAPIAFSRVPGQLTAVVLGAHECETLTADAADAIMKQIARRGARAVLAGASKEVSTRLGYAAAKNKVTLVERDIDAEDLLRS